MPLEDIRILFSRVSTENELENGKREKMEETNGRTVYFVRGTTA